MFRRIYIHNYRCLENFDLPISGKPSTLLIGKNGAGKSTVGKALQLLQRMARGTNRVGDLLRIEDFSQGRTDAPIRFEIEVSIGGVDYAYKLALELPDGFKEMRVAEESLVQNGTAVYERNRAQVLLNKSSTNNEAKFLVDWHLVALPLIQEQSDKDPLSIFKGWLARMLILAPIPSLITGDSKGDSLFPNLEVTNFGEWFSGLLAHSPAAYSHVDKYIRQVMPDFKDIKNPIIAKESRSITVQFQKNQATVSLPFQELSDGEKCFFICALLMSANDAYGPVFCFWDEPDNYLSISEVGHFLMQLRRSFNVGGQLLVTSHNSEAIPQFSNETTLLLHRLNHLEPTQVRAVADIRLHGDLVNALIRDDLDP